MKTYATSNGLTKKDVYTIGEVHSPQGRGAAFALGRSTAGTEVHDQCQPWQRAHLGEGEQGLWAVVQPGRLTCAAHRSRRAVLGWLWGVKP